MLLTGSNFIVSGIFHWKYVKLSKESEDIDNIIQ